MKPNKQSKKRKVPKVGEEGYKTPTQLRNARKRKKKKADKQVHKSPKPQDPSLRYLSSPTSAPVVQRAVSFFNRERGGQFKIIVGPTSGWRTVAKLAVRRQAGVLRIGLFVPGSHDLLEVPQCSAHHPRINAAVEILQKKCRSVGVNPYDENSGSGSLRHIAINIERSSQKSQITLVWNGSSAKDDDKIKLKDLCDALIKASEDKKEKRIELHSLWVHYNDSGKHENAIFKHTGRWEKQYGEDVAIEKLKLDCPISVPLEFPPQVFRQANIDAFTEIVAKIREWVSSRFENGCTNCVELYGGVGTIGLHLADLCESIVSSDENPYNKECFESSAGNIVIGRDDWDPSILYESKNASGMVKTKAFRDAKLLIVDPPRKGLDEDVLQALCQEKSPASLVYVSCGFDAFTRDYQELTGSGDWKLDYAEGHLLFPGSDAIETLAFFTR